MSKQPCQDHSHKYWNPTKVPAEWKAKNPGMGVSGRSAEAMNVVLLLSEVVLLEVELSS